jgi:signal transduction histidine kinase
MSYRARLIVAMLASVLLVGLVALFDERREFEAAVEALELEQETLATAVAADIEARLPRVVGSVSPPDARAIIPRLLGGAVRLERPRNRLILVAAPGSRELLTSDGRPVQAPELWTAMQDGRKSALLTREAASRMGLPSRIAIAGLASVSSSAGSWNVVVLVSGERLRSREQRAQLRFVLAITVLTSLLGMFGYVALKQQRGQLEAVRRLEVSALERERDRLLARHDKMRTIAALSGGIAHELATPLGTIVARVEQVLISVESDARSTAALNAVIEQVTRIQRVVQGLLGLVREDAPRLVRSRPEDIAESAVKLVRHRFEQSGVKLELTSAASLPAIACDPPMLEQALANLLLNACDASKRANTVHVHTALSEGRVEFVVQDEGEGISPEVAARAGEPFFTTKPRGRGTGLGLAIAHEIVAHHGGRLLLAKREDGPGTRACISLLPA